MDRQVRETKKNWDASIMERVGTTWASLRKENLIFDLLILNQIDEVDYGTTTLYHWLRSISQVGRDMIRDRVWTKKDAVLSWYFVPWLGYVIPQRRWFCASGGGLRRYHLLPLWRVLSKQPASQPVARPLVSNSPPRQLASRHPWLVVVCIMTCMSCANPI